jgi:hypothetical protein
MEAKLPEATYNLFVTEPAPLHFGSGLWVAGVPGGPTGSLGVAAALTGFGHAVPYLGQTVSAGSPSLTCSR